MTQHVQPMQPLRGLRFHATNHATKSCSQAAAPPGCGCVRLRKRTRNQEPWARNPAQPNGRGG